MGMSTHIRAFMPDTDPEFNKHKKLALACDDANVSLPKETAEYFGCDVDDFYSDLIEEKLEIDLIKDEHFVIYTDIMSEGYEVDLTRIPKGVTKLRFYNSY